MCRLAAALVLLCVGGSSAVTPVEKVISLLDGMKSDIVKEAAAEATSYEAFACFCKDTTAKKSTSVTDGQDTIDTLSASIADDTATKAADETKVQNLKAKKNSLSNDLEETTTRCAAEKAEYEGIAADFNKAISSLKSAIKAMDDKKTAIGNVKAMLQLDTNNLAGVRETLDLADAMGLIAPKQKTVSAFLQGAAGVDPENAEYSYHSGDIVDLLASLKKDFTAEKASLDSEFGKTSAACADMKKSLSGKLTTNNKDNESTDDKISKLATAIAENRGKLVEAQSLMQDDEQYLKDLTSRCETRSVEWDQRSQMRAGEIEAISTALKVLGDRVKDADADVNSRAFVQKAGPAKEIVAVKAAMSFLQRAEVNAHAVLDQEAQEQLMKEQAISVIVDTGKRLKSSMLTALAMKVAADPFKKVKDLIQGLVERLITEAAREASKKGFCDTEMGKATTDRNHRWTDVKSLTAEIIVLQAKEDALTEEVAELTKALKSLNTAVEDSTKLRKQEKIDNAKTLETANGGFEAVSEALLILRSFYKEAAKAASFLQASPVDEDTAGAGFSGSYKGKQGSSNAVLALLQTIASDFQRTIRATESDEKNAAEAYVKFQRASKVDIGGKSTKLELDQQDLKTTHNTRVVKQADMKANMDLVDDAVKTLIELRPTCVDTGMTYKERVSKREEEVTALKKALCLLDTNKVEAECK